MSNCGDMQEFLGNWKQYGVIFNFSWPWSDVACCIRFLLNRTGGEMEGLDVQSMWMDLCRQTEFQ